MPKTEFSAEATAAIARLIARIADNKYALGRHYAEWCSAAPTLESAVAAAAMAQDELGHARATYPVLDKLGFESTGLIAPRMNCARGTEVPARLMRLRLAGVEERRPIAA